MVMYVPLVDRRNARLLVTVMDIQNMFAHLAKQKLLKI